MNFKSSENDFKPSGLKNNIIIQELDKELLLYDLSRNKAFCLNETAMIVWNLCDGENSVKDIRRKTGKKLKTVVPEEIIWLVLDRLKSEQLLSNHREITPKFNGLSRREAIKQVGLSTMIALPVITALVAPIAASAASPGLCSSTTACFCLDATCMSLGDPVVLMSPCTNLDCSNTGGINCQCVGPFICSTTPGLRLGRCGLV